MAFLLIGLIIGFLIGLMYQRSKMEKITDQEIESAMEAGIGPGVIA